MVIRFSHPLATLFLFLNSFRASVLLANHAFPLLPRSFHRVYRIIDWGGCVATLRGLLLAI